MCARCQVLTKPGTGSRPKGAFDCRSRKLPSPTSCQHAASLCLTPWLHQSPVPTPTGDAKDASSPEKLQPAESPAAPTSRMPPSPRRSCQEPPPSQALQFLWSVACADAASESSGRDSCATGAADGEIRSNADPFHADWAHW